MTMRLREMAVETQMLKTGVMLLLTGIFSVSAFAGDVDATVAMPAQASASSVVVPSGLPNHVQPPTVRPPQKSFTTDDFGGTSLGRSAFTQMLRNIMPLSPRQITTLRQLFDETQRAASTYPGTPPKPTSSSVIVNMSPGAAPPIIRLRAGYVTSLVFLDASGEPWPITAYDLGNPNAFNLQPNTPDGKSNTLLVQTTNQYAPGNLAVMLKGQNTPVMLTLMPGQRAVDYRVDLRVPGLGPNAAISTSGLPTVGNPKLLTFLDGVPPSGAKALDVEGAPAQAWLYYNHVFLRTRVSLLSPGWIASISSPDGTHVFEINKTPVILASQRGEMIHMSIRGL